MSQNPIDQPVHEFVTQDPRATRVFDRLGIDYCCRGADSLRAACERVECDPSEVLVELKKLSRAAETESDAEQVSVANLSLTELADHIVDTHHDYLRRELPVLSDKIDRVVAAHGESDDRLAELAVVFATFRHELEQHLLSEEQIVFPRCRDLEAGRSSDFGPLGSVVSPVNEMVEEHEAAGNALAVMRILTDDFTPPASACPTYRSLLEQLGELERDLHLHVYKENYLLFPRAVDLEMRAVKSAGEPSA